MASHATTEHTLAPGEIAKPNTAWIWRVFGILVGITAVEFVFVFLMHPSTLRNSIFIVLTIMKAFFIVGEFMHLKHETKGLIWTILVPVALLVWLLVALITEGSFIGEVLQNMFK
ncbi:MULTISPECIES: cytochrome C oxidase subunit IV family protein [Hymenobacter]|jgi:cytochrome c oxidase subunit IV|uniref:cytochrome C oxidase subunit IV family protein n=1 Tax=Hymenobacter negativus TaxID=2795026 RepID=UPI0018DCDD6A|nr:MULTISPECIES: cytochrome C oxidase subunit IV family protein [Bacteria]MBH8568856.1 cytochrome C oxidase subunit IV family protein [Hymenobacter negativus]MBR7208590.1 cytochrome C oxidase subunit IV family protein [Microvirga sp. STS02]